MSYAFSKCLAAQTAFEMTEELFIRFLDSLITHIITPFSSSFGKFNITVHEESHLCDLLAIIRQLYTFHAASHNNLMLSSSSQSALSDAHSHSHSRTHNRNRQSHLDPTTPLSPPISGQQGAAALHSTIFKCYRGFPATYAKYFDTVMPSLSRLSAIITSRRNLTKWFRSRYDDVINTNNGNTPYKSFAEILCDILQHGYAQTNRLQEIANSKYLRNSADAKEWKENVRRHLESFMSKWDKISIAKFNLLHIELCLTQQSSNNKAAVRIYEDNRRLMMLLDVQIPTKARSKKNLFGLNKKRANQTQDGLLYIFNDMVLICSKEHNKLKGCYDLNDEEGDPEWRMQMTGANGDAKCITFMDANNKKLSVNMSKVEECRTAFDTIQQYQHVVRAMHMEQRRKRSTFSEEYIVQPISVHTLHRKSPPIPIAAAHNNISSPNSPNGNRSFAILKSSSYQSQSQSQSISQQSQLEANTKYNRGSIQSGTNSIWTENTGDTGTTFNDLSEARTSNAFSVQQTPTTHQADTPLIQSDNEEEEEDENEDETQKEKQRIKCKQFENYRSTGLQHGRRFSVPTSMLSSIASSGNTTENEGVNSTDDEACPIKRSKSFGVRLDLGDMDASKQVRFKHNTSLNNANEDGNKQNIVINIATTPMDDDDSNAAMLHNIPIFAEEEMICRQDIENVSEEECVMEEHADKEKERDAIDQIDLNKEETPEPSIDARQLAEDPHGVLNVDMEGYTAEDDHKFKMKLLLQPKWAKKSQNQLNNGVDAEFEVRDYPQVSVEEYYGMHREVLDPVKYGHKMHIHKLKKEEKLKEHMQGINKRQKEEIIQMKRDELANGIPRHPFERYLHEMHEYEEKGSQQEITMHLNVNQKKKKTKHDRIGSRELYYFDDDDNEMVESPDVPMQPSLSALDDEHPTTQPPNMAKGISAGSGNNLSISITGSGHDSQNISLSTLGPSPSLLFGKSFGDETCGEEDHTQLQQDEGNNHNNGIKCTKQILDRWNLQNNNFLLIAEVQRLRSIIAEQREDLQRLEHDVEILNESVNDKEEIANSLRSTNSAINSRLDEVGDELSDTKKEMIRLKQENERLKNIVYDYARMDMDDADEDTSSVSQSVSNRPTPTGKLPAMSWSKSDINSYSIAPDLLKDAQSRRKFDKLTHNLRNSCKLNKNNTNGNTNGAGGNKSKTKSFRKKYHSFAAGQAKKEHLMRMRDRSKDIKENETTQDEVNGAMDPLNAVKSRLRALQNLNVSGLMPQSITNMTPQASQRSTPRNERMTIGGKSKSSKSLLSDVSSPNDMTPTLSLNGPISAPSTGTGTGTLGTCTFGSPFGSPSPQCSPWPHVASFPSPKTLPGAMLVPDRTDMDKRTKSYDNITHKKTTPKSHHNGISPHSHQRKDTPTPSSSKSKKISFIYRPNNTQNNVNNSTHLDNKTAPLENIPSVPGSANSSEGSEAIHALTKRISFKDHTHKMRYVEDDDKSDISINGGTMMNNQKRNKLEKRRIMYTKSANTVLGKEGNFKGGQGSPDKSSSSGSPLTSYHQSYQSLMRKSLKKEEHEIPAWMSRARTKSFSAQKPRQRVRRSGSQTIRSSTHAKSMKLKDRTRAGSGQSMNAQAMKHSRYKPAPMTPGPRTRAKTRIIQHHRNMNSNNNNNNHMNNKRSMSMKVPPPKRRSVNFTPSPVHVLKPSQRAKQLYSKSPNFIPQHTPASYPATFNSFVLNDK